MCAAKLNVQKLIGRLQFKFGQLNFLQSVYYLCLRFNKDCITD